MRNAKIVESLLFVAIHINLGWPPCEWLSSNRCLSKFIEVYSVNLNALTALFNTNFQVLIQDLNTVFIATLIEVVSPENIWIFVAPDARSFFCLLFVFS